jgi:hypothetical protein
MNCTLEGLLLKSTKGAVTLILIIVFMAALILKQRIDLMRLRVFHEIAVNQLHDLRLSQATGQSLAWKNGCELSLGEVIEGVADTDPALGLKILFLRVQCDEAAQVFKGQLEEEIKKTELEI